MEIWKEVDEFPGYFVSNMGRVKNTSGRVMKTPPTAYGYLQVNFGRGNNRRVHKLVLDAFAGPCPPGKEGNHKNGIKSDNRIGNLEWVTSSENSQHAVKTGLVPLGKERGGTKLYDGEVWLIRKIARAKVASQGVIAKMFSISQPQVSRIVTGRRRQYV